MAVSGEDDEHSGFEVASEPPGEADGSKDSTERVVHRIAPRLYRYALVRLGRADRAEDAVGETLCRLIEKGSGLHADAAYVTGWAVRCMVNVCREYERRGGVLGGPALDRVERNDYRINSWRIDDAETANLVRAMSQLSDRQRRAVTHEPVN